jgi:hypothetical protein
MRHAGTLEEIRTTLDRQVGGKWTIETNQMGYVHAASLPKGLANGAYVGFISDTNSTASQKAQLWIEMCQAVFYVLGTNSQCVFVSTVERTHPVSKSVVKALCLEQPTELSEAERFILKKPEAKK